MDYVGQEGARDILDGLGSIWNDFNNASIGPDVDINFIMDMWNVGREWLRRELPELFTP